MTERGARSAIAKSNAAIAVKFLAAAFDDGDIQAARTYLSDTFTHHEPGVAKGATAFTAHIAKAIQSQPNSPVEPVRFIVDGDFVVVHCRRSSGIEEIATIDIFRIENEKITEFWHVFQPVPKSMANPNGMF